jgi:hypothetical protein
MQVVAKAAEMSDSQVDLAVLQRACQFERR